MHYKHNQHHLFVNFEHMSGGDSECVLQEYLTRTRTEQLKTAMLTNNCQSTS